MRQIALAAALVVITEAAAARAGGLQLASRGVRPTARGGAFVAGADDLGALWFDPAGLALMAGGDSRRSFLFDVAYVAQSAEYTRIDSGFNVQPTVKNDAPGLPVPTLAAEVDLGKKLVLAGGLMAPYAGLGRYPQDGAQRYSLVDMSESLLLIMEVALAYQVSDKLRVGAGLQNMVFQLASTMVFSGCPGQTVCAPEDPEMDALGKISQLDWFSPSGVLGVQYDLARRLRVGAALQLPFWISGKGHFETVLPDSGFYDGASVVGDRADVSFTLPAIARAGIEAGLGARWKAELAGSIEFWSMHDDFDVQPRDVRIENAPGVGTYEIGPMNIPRHYRNTYSVHVGLEGQPLASTPLRLLLGWSYETAAAPDAYLSVLTVDGARNLLAGGLGWRHGRWTVDAMFGVVMVADRHVDPAVGVSPQLSPVRDDPEDPDPPRVYVNWGDYKSSWIMGGAGLSAGF
ncbi:MAG TPA: outer membrane protein transport protein [Kofleriaceae bacterium]|nr:outer membrane protein transport protein [Kofleriaceae bacterium]